MKTLDRILLYDLRRMWRQGIAISLLLACGVALFVMATSSMRSLETTMNQYYEDYRFADAFAQLVRAPNQLIRRIAEIPGVERVQSRIIRDVLLHMPDMIEPASCRLVSIEPRENNGLNGVYLCRGRMPVSGDRTEVIVSELFADAHCLKPGDSLVAIMAGRKETLHIVGIALSPEYIYVVQPGLLLTDDRRFGVVWMPRRQMAAAFNMEGAFNNIAIKLTPGVMSVDVISKIDRLAEPYGGTGAYDREDQDSHRRVSDEMHQMRTMAYVTPSIFLAVSAFLFNIVFTRMVNGQAEQIATLRAFGYRAWEVGFHYAKFVILLVIIGASTGWYVGVRLSWWMTDEYVKFFRFPSVDYQFASGEAVFAVLIGLTAALIGTFSAIRRATTLPPAVAMRPEAPKEYRGLIAERTGFSKLLSPVGRMIVRRLETNRLSTVLAVLGMGLAVAVLVLGSFMQDTVNYVIELQFDKAQRQDVMLTFNDTLSPSAIHDIGHLPGVTTAEPFRAVPVRLRNGVRTHRLGLMGLSEHPQLYRILDEHEHTVSFPVQGGLTISQKLAEILDVELGQLVDVEILERERLIRQMPVATIFPNFTDPSAFLNRAELHRLLHEGDQLSGAFVSVDSKQIDNLYRAVKEMPSIAAVQDKNAAKKNFESTVSASTWLMRLINAIFSAIIALGVIYNCAMILLAERSRDLATLRVMGFNRREVSSVLLGELAIVTLLAIPVGLPIGYGFAYFTTLALDTESHRFPLVIERSTYAYATVVVLAAASLSALYVRRMLNSLDLISVLKVKE